MDLEELIGTLFTLYILGSIVAGFLRRGSRSSEKTAGPESEAERTPERSGFPDVLDMDELERRLREIRAGRRPDGEAAPQPADPRPFSTAPSSIPAPTVTAPSMPAAPEPTHRPLVSSRKSHPAGAPAPAGPMARPTPVPSRAPVMAGRTAAPVDDWDDSDSNWTAVAVARPAGQPRPSRRRQLPAAIETYMQRGNPWQAAFVIKELLGPPRALQPHSRRPRF